MTPNQSESFSSTDRTESTADIVVRLRDTPNWMRESFGHWKSCTKEYDRAPFDAAVEIERLRAINAELLEAAQEALVELYRLSPSLAAPKLRAAIEKATA